MDYDRTHQSYLESKYKAQKQNGTFLSFHPLYEYWSIWCIFQLDFGQKGFIRESNFGILRHYFLVVGRYKVFKQMSLIFMSLFR